MSLTAAEEMELLTLLEVEDRYRTAHNYYAYVQKTHELIYQYTRHGEFICNVLNEATEKRVRMKAGEIPTETQYLMFSLPAQHGKSMHITETYPSYFLGRFPNDGVIEISYNEGFASKFGGRNKDKIQEYGPELFNISVAKDKSGSTEWDLVDEEGKKTRGGMISRGIMSGITGSSLGDCIIIDDPIKNREEANSETIRNKHWDEWQDSIRRRIHPGGIVILIMTRWHEDDLWGRLLSDEHARPFPWQVYNLPLECDKMHIEKEGNPLNRELGEPLWPERYGYDHIEEAKSYPASFNSMDQGRPSNPAGNMLQRKWWRYYEVEPDMLQLDEVIQSWDCTFKDSDGSDYVVGQVWGRKDADKYLLDSVRARMDINQTMDAIRNMTAKWPKARLKLIEDKANGPAIIQMLNKKVGGMVAINPKGSKQARVSAVSPDIEAGNVFLPSNRPWVQDFIEEAAAFPKGAHDDQVDAMSQALDRWTLKTVHKPREKPQGFFVGTELEDLGYKKNDLRKVK